MGIFKVKPGEVDYRPVVRDVVLVPVGIEEQVGGIENPDTLPPAGEAGGDAETVEKGLLFLEPVLLYHLAL